MSVGPTDPVAWGRLDPYVRPDLSRSALVTIDVQVDFLAGGANPLPGADQVVPAIAGLVAAFRSVCRPIMHVVRLYEGPDVDLVRRSAIESGAQVVRPGTPGSQLAPVLAPPDAAGLDPARLLAGRAQELGPGEVVIFKPRWSAFYRTRVHEHLTSLGVDTLVVAGLNYPNCPRATIADASARDYRVVMAQDALSGVVDLHRDEAVAIGVVPATSHTITELLTARNAVTDVDQRCGLGEGDAADVLVGEPVGDAGGGVGVFEVVGFDAGDRGEECFGAGGGAEPGHGFQ